MAQVGLLSTEVFFCYIKCYICTFTSDPLPPLDSILFEKEYKVKKIFQRIFVLSSNQEVKHSIMQNTKLLYFEQKIFVELVQEKTYFKCL